jgi:hypothetical protein
LGFPLRQKFRVIAPLQLSSSKLITLECGLGAAKSRCLVASLSETSTTVWLQNGQPVPAALQYVQESRCNGRFLMSTFFKHWRTEDAPITVGGRRNQTLADSGPGDFDLYHRPDTNCFPGRYIANLVDRVAMVSTMSWKSGAKRLQTDENPSGSLDPVICTTIHASLRCALGVARIARLHLPDSPDRE